MLRRTLATALWAYFGWYAASVALTFMGMPTTLAPAGAVIMAGIALVDRRPLTRRAGVATATDTIAQHPSS